MEQQRPVRLHAVVCATTKHHLPGDIQPIQYGRHRLVCQKVPVHAAQGHTLSPFYRMR